MPIRVFPEVHLKERLTLKVGGAAHGVSPRLNKRDNGESELSISIHAGFSDS